MFTPDFILFYQLPVTWFYCTWCHFFMCNSFLQEWVILRFVTWDICYLCTLKVVVLVHFTAASSVYVHFLLIQYSVPLLSQLQFPINKMVWNMHNNTNSTDISQFFGPFWVAAVKCTFTRSHFLHIMTIITLIYRTLDRASRLRKSPETVLHGRWNVDRW